MNFNLYLKEDETGQQRNKLAKLAGESRNALVRQAVGDWLSKHDKPQWPDEVLERITGRGFEMRSIRTLSD